jgi:osmotically-inducible protein OsmY
VMALLAVLLSALLAGAIALPGVAAAQTGGPAEESIPPTAPPPPGAAPSSMPPPSGSVPGPAIPPPSSPTTSAPEAMPPAASEAPRKAAAKPATKRRSHRAKAPNKPPGWVMQSKVQLALQSDPRFKNVHATVTQPGVIVLEGDVFDNDAKAAAQRTASSVEGVNRVINTLTTNSLKWLLAQNRINQALQVNGFPLVSVKVIGQTAYISGQVKSAADKDRATALVTSTEPDVTVGTNLITVVSPGL